MRKIPIPLPPRFETAAYASAQSAELISALTRLQSPPALALAAKLDSCVRGQRCGSGACPTCNRLLRVRLHPQVLTAVPSTYDIVRISLIPASYRVEVGQLSATDLRKWVTSRQRGIARALPAGALFYGGVDVSLNTFDNADPHWALHLYGFMLAPPTIGLAKRYRRLVLRRALVKHCPPIRSGDRVANEAPLLMSLVSRSVFEANHVYTHKAGFYRRSRYSYVKRVSGKRSTNVQAQSLPAGEAAELAMFLDAYPLGTRLVLKGLRRRGQFASFVLARE